VMLVKDRVQQYQRKTNVKNARAKRLSRRRRHSRFTS